MFERFTPDARATVVHAQEQARSLGHNYIGTEHLLLAVLSLEGSVTAEVLGAIGITAEAVRSDILQIAGLGEGAEPGHIPFTPRSKKVLELSLREALQLNHNTITSEHILLGLLREGEGLATQILLTRDVDIGRLRGEIIGRMPAGVPRRGLIPRVAVRPSPSRMPLTPAAARAANRAKERAGGGPVGSQDYLLGLLDDHDSLAAKALAALGITKESVEAKLTELSAEGSSDEPPERVGGRTTSLATEGDLVTVRITDADLAERVRAQMEAMSAEILHGPQLPGAEKLWLAVHPAVEESVRRLEEEAYEAHWRPPVWARTGVATYSMLSRPSGPAPRLWVADGVDAEAVRAFLAGWLRHQPPGGQDDQLVAYLSIAVSRAADIVPDAADPNALVVSHWSSGPGGPRPDWPRVPLADLVAASLADLQTERAA